jgi:hypothetical protein
MNNLQTLFIFAQLSLSIPNFPISKLPLLIPIPYSLYTQVIMSKTFAFHPKLSNKQIAPFNANSLFTLHSSNNEQNFRYWRLILLRNDSFVTFMCNVQKLFGKFKVNHAFIIKEKSVNNDNDMIVINLWLYLEWFYWYFKKLEKNIREPKTIRFTILIL